MYNRIKHTQQTAPDPTMWVFRVPKMTLTVEELAEELNISFPTAYNLVKQDAFPAFHIGQRILVNRAGLQRWIDRQCASEAGQETDAM